MPEYQTDHIVPHAAADMFDLVADVERYPEFVPLCESLVVRSQRAGDNGTSVLIADMAIGYRLVRESFTSRVVLDRPNLVITADPISGPFRTMENVWRFVERDTSSCTVSFRISYEFRSRALALVMGSMFDRAFRTFSEAFEARADLVHGRALPSGSPAG